MMNFKFKMEKVLEYKSNVEKSKVEDYARMNNKLSLETEHLSNLESELKERTREKVTEINAMKMQFLYKEKLKTQVQHQKVKVEEVFQKTNVARDVLIEARKDRKIMEMLKDKDKEKHRHEMLLQEQKELDDLSIMRFAK